MPEIDAVSQQQTPQGKGREIVPLIISELPSMVFWAPDNGLATVEQWLASSAVFLKSLLEKEKFAIGNVPADPVTLGQKIIADLEARVEMGKKKYGEPLRAFNGRDAILDAYQETLDGWNYVRQKREENEQREMKRFMEGKS